MSPPEFWIRFIVMAGTWLGWFALFHAAHLAAPAAFLLATVCALVLSAIDLLAIFVWELIIGGIDL